MEEDIVRGKTIEKGIHAVSGQQLGQVCVEVPHLLVVFACEGHRVGTGGGGHETQHEDEPNVTARQTVNRDSSRAPLLYIE